MNKAKRKRNEGSGRTNKATEFNLKFLIALNCHSA